MYIFVPLFPNILYISSVSYIKKGVFLTKISKKPFLLYFFKPTKWFLVTTPYLYLFCQKYDHKKSPPYGKPYKGDIFLCKRDKKGFLTKKCLAICLVVVLFFWRFLPLRDQVGVVASWFGSW
jgi:hypothetical protein